MEITICLATSLKLGRYLHAVYGNWDNNKSDTNIAAGNKKKENHDNLENIKEYLNNLYIFYDKYN